MQNTSLPGDVWSNATTTSSEDGQQALNLFYSRDLALKVMYIIIGTVGVLGNLFVVFIFLFFIKIHDRVRTLLNALGAGAQSTLVGQTLSENICIKCANVT